MRTEPLIYELSKPGRRGISVPEPNVPEYDVPDEMKRDELDLPEVSEIDVIRHFTRLSHLNHAIDIDFYPLGSCTMKYNPKINELMSKLPGFGSIHPEQDPSTIQGALGTKAVLIGVGLVTALQLAFTYAPPLQAEAFRLLQL
jgi:glycine dehydrogenase subunit 2